jgi:hypothetical protein
VSLLRLNIEEELVMETTLQEAYCSYLTAEGFPTTHIDDEGDVIFRCEGRVYLISVQEDCPERFALVLPSFWGLDDDQEAHLALTIGNEVNLRVFGVTLFIGQQSVSAAVELFLANPAEDIKAVLYPSLKAIQGAVYRFASLMHKAQGADPLPVVSAPVPAHTSNGAETTAGYL